MIEITGDLFEQECDAICITTNGHVKKDGTCVMGRGCAKEALERWPNIGKVLGAKITARKNQCYLLGYVGKFAVASFPVKHHWRQNADLDLIEQSCKQIKQLADKHNWKVIVIPRPGCGNGKLDWEQVKPILKQELDNRFRIITHGEDF